MQEEEKIEIEIPEAVTNMIWRLDTDCQGYKDIIEYILSHEDFGVNKELFNEYQQKYLDAKFAFEVAKQEIAKKYINIKNTHYIWNLKYDNNIISITPKEL